MTTYRTRGVQIGRLQAIATFITTCRLPEDQVLAAGRSWCNGADIADTAAGRTLRETVRRSSEVRIIPPVGDERAAWASPVAATLFATFAGERSVAISRLRAERPGADFNYGVLSELRDWLGDNYALLAADREAWLIANQTALSLAITQLQTA